MRPWLVSLFIGVTADAPIGVDWLGVFVLLQLGRVWVLHALGRYWTTRIIAVPGAAPVETGPYRCLRRPNHAIGGGGIAVLPLVFGAWLITVYFSVLNLALIVYRVGIEDRALAERRAGSTRESHPR